MKRGSAASSACDRLTMRLVGVLVMLMSACSIPFVHSPSTRGMECTSSRSIPIGETIGMAVFVTAAVATKVTESPNCGAGDFPCFTSAFVGLMAFETLSSGIAALYGYVTVASCRRYRAQYPRALEAAKAHDCEALRALLAEDDTFDSLFRADPTIGPTIAQCGIPPPFSPPADGST